MEVNLAVRYGRLRVFMAVLGMIAGYFISRKLSVAAMTTSSQGVEFRAVMSSVGAGGLAGFLVAPLVGQACSALARSVDTGVRKLSALGVVSSALGVIIGLIIANLLAVPIALIPTAGSYIAIGVNIVLAVAGLILGYHKREEIMSFIAVPRSAEGGGRGHHGILRDRSLKSYTGKARPKLLDTSVIIDGRIADIADSRFIEGVLVVPSFVLEELQHIADSSDVLKRNRGRRGLDILNRMQKDEALAIEIVDKRMDDAEVDAKLIRLAQMMDATILTNDFNLNKVAELHGVDVLNINELANALKPVVLPGEEMTVHIVKDGKESGQGVAYLDDGTMVVVDGGRRHIGDSIGVMVTSVLQTSAGRMIFAKLKVADRAV